MRAKHITSLDYLKDNIHLVFDEFINMVLNTKCYVHIVGKIRRFFIVHFKKQYLREQLLARRGKCNKCGMCCNLLYTCPMLKKDGRCLIYGKCRPKVCKVFPIDQRDIDEIRMCGGICGYYFEDIKSIR